MGNDVWGIRGKTGEALLRRSCTVNGRASSEHLEHLERARARCVCEVAEMQSPSRAGQSCGQS
jgi:hypothetical protein